MADENTINFDCFTMSSHTDIYIDSQIPISNLLQILNFYFKINFTKRKIFDDIDDFAYDGITNSYHISVHEDHGIVDDSGIEFTKFRYRIVLSKVLRVGYDQKLELKLRHKFAWEMCDIFSANIACNLIVVDDVQRLVPRIS